MIRIIACAGVIALPFTAWWARAHDAPQGWSYSAYCCSGRDCAEAHDGAVIITRDGYAVVIQPGEHPMVTQRVFKALVPFDAPNIYPSPDGRFHVCIVSGAVRCLYAPPMGM